MGVRQPVVQGRQPHLGAVTQDEKNEGDVEQGALFSKAASPISCIPAGSARLMKKIPARAIAMPTEQRIRYFHAAARELRLW